MSKAARQRSARERLAEERKRQEQRERRVRALVVGFGALVVVALVVVVTVYFVNKKEPGEYTGALAPVKRESNGSVLMANPSAQAPRVEIFEDFQCPVCQEFEKTTSATVKKLASQGKANVVYFPFRLFRQDPAKTNSNRAANAALCAPGDQKWIKFHDTIYKNQPPENQNGFSDKDLIGWGKEAGVSGPAFESCVKGLQKQSQLDQMTAYAGDTRKVDGTPALFINGQQVSNDVALSAKNLEKAILAAGPAPATSAPATPKAKPSKSPQK